ncbi:MAG: DNA-3-methyladenine glycosylase [Bacillota bacterium]
MKLKRDFYTRDTLTVARELLGKYLIHKSTEGKTIGKIVEVEAYIGPNDAASHAFESLKSKRTEIQFGIGGYAYIYFIYGMYYCFNVVTNIEERPEVVLVRAIEPIEGIELMKMRRKTTKILNLCNGPGKLTIAMGISKEHYGIDLCGDTIYLEEGEKIQQKDILETVRINIDYAGEAKHYPWRYIIKNNRFVSVLK